MNDASERIAYGRIPLMAAAMAALLIALWAGLARLGVEVPPIRPTLPLAHGPLMVCGFLGTLISLERAVALGARWSYAAPALTAAGALALIAGLPDPAGPLLIALGSAGLVANFIVIVRRQTAPFTITMGLGAAAWLVGNCLWLGGVAITGMYFWWTAFLVLTIAGERLELSRLSAVTERSRAMLIAGIGIFIAGLAGASFSTAGLRLAGAGMLAIALWLWRYDLARRTIRQHGLTRFMAVNLLAGYVWLGAGALAWICFNGDLTTFRYDLMLHTIFLGFVFSMIFAHAPVIFPAVLQRPLPYRPAFYAHVAILHLSLLIRIGGDLAGSYRLYEVGGILNLVALLVFVANTAASLARGAARRSLPSRPAQTAARRAV
jgi:hypothetical protein